MRTIRRLVCAASLMLSVAAVPAGMASALQNPTTGQPGTTAGFNCATASAPAEPGQAANAPGSAFNETAPGTAATVYAGNGPASTAHAGSPAAVSQYDAACRRLSSR
jgi:hypothetical protein